MFQGRLKQIRYKLKKEKVDAVLISSVSNISYVTGYANFSKDEREGYLLIGEDFQYLITDGRYSEAVKKEIPHFQLFERNHQTSFEQLFKQLKNQIKNLGIEEDNLTVAEHKLIKRHFKTRHFKTKEIRSIKHSDEIEKIEKACRIGDLAFDYVLRKFKVGVSEEEIALELEDFIRGKKAKISFPPIIAFGENSAIPHHQTGQTKLEKGQIILLDFGVKWGNYCSDMTRTIFFGKATQKHRTIYEVVLEAQKRAVEFINRYIKEGKGIKAKAVDQMARKYITSQSYPTIPHSLGHGIGLEVHEHPYLSPKSKEFLKMGMVFSVEPGIYISDFGGVRIEDLFVLEERELRQITTSSKKLIEV